MDINNKKIEQENKDNNVNKLFFDKYYCVKKIGEGSFGNIYKGIYNGHHYALKFEKKSQSKNFLEKEAIIMNYLKGPYIPNIKYYGSTSDYNILVMQLLGKNLENLFEIHNKRFSLKTVCMIGYQFVEILEYIHNKHILHRDIKPDNFVIGLNNLSKYIYLLDFGLAKKYRSSKTLKQIPLVNNQRIIGTMRYASINAIKGYEHSRRDDLEAAGYILISFIKGKLPWDGIHGKTKEERYEKILKKKNISTKELCKDLPEEFEKYIYYTRNLEYEEEPNYKMLKELFTIMIKKANCIFDYIYDWSTSEEILMRKIDVNKNELESCLNSKSTSLTSFRYIENNNEEKKERSLNFTFHDENKTNLMYKFNICNIDKNVNINERNKAFEDDEEAIILPKKKDYLNTINDEEEIVCCSSVCNIF